MKAINVFFWVLGLVAFSMHGFGADLPENVDSQKLAKVKAAYICNIIKFAHWSDEALPQDGNIRIGLLGDDAVVQVMKRDIQSIMLQKHTISITQIQLSDTASDQSQLREFHLIYVAEGFAIDALPKQVQGANTLLVGGDNFIENGGMVGLVLNQATGKVSLQVNIQALEGQLVTLSSRLLSVADIHNRKTPLKLNQRQSCFGHKTPTNEQYSARPVVRQDCQMLV